MGKWTRRAVIGAGGLVGGGLLLGVGEFVFAPNRLRLMPDDGDEAVRLTTWIRLSPDSTVTVIVPHCEMGQGAQTGLAMMLAEELDAEWSQVRVEEAPAQDEFAAGYMVRGFALDGGNVPQPMTRGADHLTYKVASWIGLQVTGGSGSIRFTGEYGMRVAGAAAKQMLLQAAANRWNVPIEELTAEASAVHDRSGKHATYGELAAEAAKLSPPTHPPLKARENFKLIGTTQPRFDIPNKVNGGTTYGLDVQLPDMVYAAIKAAPVFGGKLQSVDATAASAMPGVVRVVQLSNAVAIVADGYWRAQQVLNSLKPVFDDGGMGDVSTASIFDRFSEALDRKSSRAKDDGSNISAEYRVPYLAHATMEPMNATARIVDGRCEVWAGTQDPLHARDVAAKAAGLNKNDVTIHNLQLGGGFGRRLPQAMDFVDQAVRIAKEVSPRPVKLIWSREEDFRHDFYRSAVLGRLKATLDPTGRPTTWSALFTGSASEGAAEIPYAIPKQAMSRKSVDTHIRLGSWRSVDHTQHGFFTESFIDELAHAAKQDPFEYRRQLLSDRSRHKAVLELAAEKAGWANALPQGWSRGIAIVESFGSIVCEVVEIEILKEGAANNFAVRRVVAAVDCGNVVNPDAGIAQIEGGIIFGLSAALFGEINIEKGAVVQGNFNDHPVVRMADAPRIEVYFLASDAKRGGLGEPGVPPIAPAVTNALFAATQQRIRTLPIYPIRKNATA